MLFLDKCVATLGGCILTLIFRVAPIIRQRQKLIDILKPKISLHFFHKNYGFNKKRSLKTIQKYIKKKEKKEAKECL